MIKNILCYGDSNTWGESPEDAARFSFTDRWPGVLQEILQDNFKIYEAGLSGRTTCYDDPEYPDRNGLKFLPLTLESNSPIDLLIIMLGTNDCKDCFNLSAQTISESLAKLITYAKNFEPMINDFLIISPAVITKGLKWENSDSEIARSKELVKHYRELAIKHNCHFLDANEFIKVSPLDGVHFDQENHKLLGKAVADLIINLTDYKS